MRSSFAAIGSWIGKLFSRARGRTRPRYNPRLLGPQTRRRLDAVSDLLLDDDLAAIVELGRSERDLLLRRDDIREVKTTLDAVARELNTALERIDAFISQPDGPLARALLLLPAWDRDEGRRRLARVNGAAEELVRQASDALEAQAVLSLAKNRIEALAEQHGRFLPQTWTRAMAATRLSERLRLVASPDAARRLARSVEQFGDSLGRQRRCYEYTAEELCRAATSANVDLPPAVNEAADLESFVQLAAEYLELDARARLSSVSAQVLETARLHHRWLVHEVGFVKAGGRRPSLPRDSIFDAWNKLHALKPQARTARGTR